MVAKLGEALGSEEVNSEVHNVQADEALLALKLVDEIKGAANDERAVCYEGNGLRKRLAVQPLSEVFRSEDRPDNAELLEVADRLMGGFERLYSIFLGYEVKSALKPSELLTEEQKAYMGLLALKHSETVRHTMEVFMMTYIFLEGSDFSLQEKRDLLTATLIHDYGKGDLPNIVLENPFSYPEWNNAFPETASKPGNISDISLDDLARCLSGSNRDVLIFDNRTRIGVTNDVRRQILDSHAEALEGEDVMANYEAVGLKGEMSYREALDIHEIRSLAIIDKLGASDTVKAIVGLHHDYALTRDERDKYCEKDKFADERTVAAGKVIKFADIMSAMVQWRLHNPTSTLERLKSVLLKAVDPEKSTTAKHLHARFDEFWTKERFEMWADLQYQFVVSLWGLDVDEEREAQIKESLEKKAA